MITKGNIIMYNTLAKVNIEYAKNYWELITQPNYRDSERTNLVEKRERTRNYDHIVNKAYLNRHY